MTYSINYVDVLNVTCNIFLMQLGFLMLEVGTVRKKNVNLIIVKNICDANAAALGFWFCGYAIGFLPSTSSFIGGDGANGIFMHNNTDYKNWLYQWSFLSTSVSIVSGAVAERCTITAYVSYAFFMSLIVYPVVAYWVWSLNGWLSCFNTSTTRVGSGAIDLAGAGAVHLVGGISSLVGAYMVGPRNGRFVQSDKGDGVKTVPFSYNSQASRAMGIFILWFAWYHFNSGSVLQLDISEDAKENAGMRVAFCTTISACACSMTAMILHYYMKGDLWNVNAVQNGILGGLVSITGCCAVVEPWAAFLIGILGAFVMVYCQQFVLYLEIDDVVDAIAVHAGCGTWSIIAGAFLAKGSYFEEVYRFSSKGIFYGGHGEVLGSALAYVVCTVAWTAVLASIFFYGLHSAKMLRLPEHVIDECLDEKAHGKYAFLQQYAGIYKGRTLPPEALRKATEADKSLDKVALLALAIENEVLDTSALLRLFNSVSGGDHTIEGSELESFIQSVRDQYAPVNNETAALSLLEMRNRGDNDILSSAVGGHNAFEIA